MLFPVAIDNGGGSKASNDDAAATATAEQEGQLLGCEDCVVCMAAPRAFVFFPCRHLTHCEICQAAHKLTQCPLCREEGTPVRVFR